MGEEPRHKYWSFTVDEQIGSYPLYLPDEGAVGLWEIVIDGRRWFGLSGVELTDYVRRSVSTLLEHGAKPVKEVDGKEHYWVLQPQYGSANAEIVDAVIAEWLASGARAGDPSGICFALPKICETRKRRDGLQRMLDFLNFLNEKKIHFFIEQIADDSLMATLTLVGARVEVTFNVDDMTFSVFGGGEDVIMEEKLLYDLIEENWGDD